VFVLLLVVVHGGERYRRMGVSTASSHLGGDPDRLHDFLWACSVFHRRFGMTLDAIRALRDVCSRDGNKLFCLSRQRALGKNALLNASNADWIVGASSRRLRARSWDDGG
jgi:hypothetical protein